MSNFLSRSILAYILSSFFFNSVCFSQEVESAPRNLLLDIIAGKDKFIDSVLSDSSKYHIQFILGAYETQQNVSVVKNYYINKDAYYFNPASLIKFPVAIVALEKLSRIKKKYGISLTDSIDMTPCSCDRSTIDYIRKTSTKTIEQFLRELFIMSNNDAFNLFYDLVGPNETNERMRSLGFQRITLRNRFTSSCDSMGNLTYGGIGFFEDQVRKKYQIFCDTASILGKIDPSWPHVAGKFVYKNKKIIPGAKNYTTSNYVSLSDAHDLMIRLIDESQAPRENRLKIDSSMKQVLLKAMGDFPRELTSNNYQTSQIPDYYYKFFLDPSTMHTADNSLRFYNKVGIAAGFISDVSYVVDETKGITYFLSGSMMAKKDEIMDNGKFNYYDIALPLFRKIGTLIYQYFLEQSTFPK